MVCKRCFFVMGIVLGVALAVSAWSVNAKADTLLLDTFNNVTNPDTYGDAGDRGLNMELDQTYRQSGTYANTSYVRNYNFSSSSGQLHSAQAQPFERW